MPQSKYQGAEGVDYVDLEGAGSRGGGGGGAQTM